VFVEVLCRIKASSSPDDLKMRGSFKIYCQITKSSLGWECLPLGNF
jgi:hypothetical protein